MDEKDFSWENIFALFLIASLLNADENILDKLKSLPNGDYIKIR